MKRYLAVLLLLLLTTACFSQDSLCKLGPDSKRQPSVLNGTITKNEWESKVYNNYREYVYVPAQYISIKQAALMVFQDGHYYLNETGDFRIPIVYDNLILQKKLPVTICLFVNQDHNSKEYPENRFRASNRADEYNVLNG